MLQGCLQNYSNKIVYLDFRLSINQNIIREDVDMLRLKRQNTYLASDYDNSRPKKKVKI